jgi:hypothetical protein
VDIDCWRVEQREEVNDDDREGQREDVNDDPRDAGRDDDREVSSDKARDDDRDEEMEELNVPERVRERVLAKDDDNVVPSDLDKEEVKASDRFL